MADAPSRGGPVPWIVGVVWLGAAIGLGASGVLERLPRPAVQGVLAWLTAFLLIGAFAIRPMRMWVRSIPLRALIGLHLTRAVAGSVFLVMYGQHRLPWEFAVPAGWGDIAVAALAVVVLAIGPETARGRVPMLVWNTLGLIDILFVVGTAARLGLKDGASMVELTRLPLCVLPLWLVPLIIASHVVIFARLRGAGLGTEPPR